MKSQIVVLAIVLAGLPALAWGQAPCGCNSRHASGVRLASHGAWADYEPAGYHGGGGCGSCGSCAPTCSTPCCRPLLCIIPNTVRKIGHVLDCLIPCGPRNCGGCDSCGGCSSCGSPAMHGNPFIDDEALPPVPAPAKPKVQDTRRQPSLSSNRQMAAAPSAGSKQGVNGRAATKSVLTRAPQSQDEEVVSRATHTDTATKKPTSVVKRTSATAPVSESTTQSARRQVAIPHNPLR